MKKLKKSLKTGDAHKDKYFFFYRFNITNYCVSIGKFCRASFELEPGAVGNTTDFKEANKRLEWGLKKARMLLSLSICLSLSHVRTHMHIHYPLLY
jgi:hypothetical protein